MMLCRWVADSYYPSKRQETLIHPHRVISQKKWNFRDKAVKT